MQTVPFIYSAHHAGTSFGEFSHRTALTEQQQYELSDYGTAETVAQNGILTLVAPYSRGLVDLNRAPDDPDRFVERTPKRPDALPIWQPDQEPTEEEKRRIDRGIYHQYHQQINDAITASSERLVVVAWDNAGHYVIGKNRHGHDVTMPPFIISNHGQENSSRSDSWAETSCDPVLLDLLAKYLRKQLATNGLPSSVHMNLVFKGGYISEHYNTLRHPEIKSAETKNPTVQSFQVEYDGTMTQDAQGEQDPDKQEALRQAFEAAVVGTWTQYMD